MLNILKRKSKPVTVRLYSGIHDIPLWNWEQILEKGRFELLIYHEYQRELKIPKNRIIQFQNHLQNAYDKITDEYFAALDVDFTNDEIFILIQQKLVARQRLMDGDKSQVNFIRAYDSQINEIKKGSVKMSLVKNRMLVEKWFGQPIDPRKKTVAEFIEIVKLMQEEANLKRKHGKNNEG